MNAADGYDRDAYRRTNRRQFSQRDLGCIRLGRGREDGPHAQIVGAVSLCRMRLRHGLSRNAEDLAGTEPSANHAYAPIRLPDVQTCRV